ncbi:MAG: hypothetical protein HY741_10785 [Chloroflexi bacterium]|nr:hypothetical protein [Chloroflexota bacterium]
MADFQIPDMRSTEPKDYVHAHRRGRLKQSWAIGVESQSNEMLMFNEGLTWGSIGQILGYLFGDTDDAFQDEMWERMLDNYKRMKRGSAIE